MIQYERRPCYQPSCSCDILYTFHRHQTRSNKYPQSEKMHYSFSMAHRKDGAFFMTASISQELRLFAEELQHSLSLSTLQQVAREVGFVQRESKYRAQDLAALCVWLSQSVAQTSLTQLCSCLEASTGVLMSPSGLISTPVDR